MCGRFSQQRPSAELAALFEAEDLAGTPGGRFNLAPQQQGLVVVQGPDGRRAVTSFRWGLVPPWATDQRIGNRLINARAETVATTPAFRSSFARRRCLVPADGFYEWQRVAERVRQPHFISRADEQPLAFAGLWSPWRDPEAETPEPLRTFTIVTTRANATVAPIHDRMPVVLPPEAWAAWLGAEPAEPAELLALLRPAPDELLVRHPVSTRVNNARNEGPELVRPLGPTAPDPEADAPPSPGA
ncbi:MAG: SOS response-associated peptidase [Chloroflexi bacterium]|jgi:putative SOS response-associated peptidase YedK|nr:SOS response-associated peptidase [Chloroflexota bacterium]